MSTTDIFSGSNSGYIQELYEKYLENPNQLEPSWQYFFSGFEAGGGYSHKGSLVKANDGLSLLVHTYRSQGHFCANLDPLQLRVLRTELLDLSHFGFTETDLQTQVGAGGFKGPTEQTLASLIEGLKKTYCQSIGVEFVDSNTEQKEWLLEKIEPTFNQPQLDKNNLKDLLKHLYFAKEFELFLHTKFLGAKRFSIEGGESLIPMLDCMVEKSVEMGAGQMVFGMAHRGRLNVLAHILQKPYEKIFKEFEGKPVPKTSQGDGDVKYHQGYSSDKETKFGKIHLSLSPNPSHLELVNPVVEGMVRGKQYYFKDTDHSKVIPVLIHGEAAFAGQGIVFETLNLSQLAGYRTGGTVHIIINNQVGFTATADQTRFTPYPTDVAKVIQAPIFHVNGEDPIAVLQVAKLAIEYRQKFKSDVMIDLWCYRKHGHNETDDPTFTQPSMYKLVEEKEPISDLFAKKLISENILTQQEVTSLQTEVKQSLNEAFTRFKEGTALETEHKLGGFWTGIQVNGEKNTDTRIGLSEILEISKACSEFPESFTVHPKLIKLYEARNEMAHAKKNVDWGTAEMWAFGSLLKKGIPVRLAGQDCERGTFSHRHAVLHDYKTNEFYVPLKQLAKEPGDFFILNSMLSELAVLGFEWGYSTVNPHQLVLWEAQFGDFVNGAQPIIDQYIATSESKWSKLSGVVLLLPHGYEGQGPEHSSGRLERFLQLCGDDNIQVCYPSMPAQYFHVLRRQVFRNYRKPLVLMMPKSLLRHEKSSSPIIDFTEKSFETVIDDSSIKDANQVKKVIFCSGKIFITLSTERETQKISNVAIVRVEELYPFPEMEIRNILKKYSKATQYIWAQEEPQNMGAWSFISPRILKVLGEGRELIFVGREEAASPAVGSHKVHELEEKDILKNAFQ